jgi:hypothetical protein
MQQDKASQVVSTSPAANGEEQFLSPRGLASLLLVEQCTLAAWRRRGIGPPWYRILGHLIRYERADVLAWIRGQNVDADVAAPDGEVAGTEAAVEDQARAKRNAPIFEAGKEWSSSL